MTTMTADTDPILSDPKPLTLVSGLEINVERLKTRQMMRLMRILTRGAGDALTGMKIDGDTDAAEFTGQLLAAVVFSIPEAEDETVDFVRSMVSPVGIVARPNKEQREQNETLLMRLDSEFQNPEPEDLITVLEKVVEVEAPHLVALGKRVAALLKVQRMNLAARTPKNSSEVTS